MGNLVSIQAGKIFEADWAGRMKKTAIDKRTVDGLVVVGNLGIEGDQQADVDAPHGGIDRAIYAYSREDLDRWSGLLNVVLHNGQFGENLTTQGIDSSRIVVGEKWQVGSTILEVSAPRIPCVVFANWLKEKNWVNRFADDGRPGPYLRVLQEGNIQAGDAIKVFDVPEHGVTVSDVLFAYLNRLDSVAKAAAIAEQLPADIRDRVWKNASRAGLA